VKPKVLLAVTVYNGRSFVGRALESARRVSTASADVDVLALDDCSPEPGFSEWLAGVCGGLGVMHYRSPRNLGIVRNVNLGLLYALEEGYDHVIIANSDVIFPANLVDEMLRALASDERIGSVTAWSNNVSVYSLPNVDPDSYLADQNVVDWVSATLAGWYSGTAIDIPAGISFAILIPTAVLHRVGVMDTIYGRGYCEETDWSLRSLATGYRITLAPAAFVYHAGRGSTLAAGLVAGGHSTVPENEAVIDLRYPLFRSQVGAFVASGVLEEAHQGAIRAIVRAGGRQFGYDVEVGWLASAARSARVQCLVAPDARPIVRASFLGFSWTLGDVGLDVAAVLHEEFGGPPTAVNLLERNTVADRVAGGFGLERVQRRRNYPTRV
jgi:GT2 family glycosyltransferase